MSDILYIIALSLGSIITLFILSKLMGYKQISEMSMFDYITGISIGSIAAEMATSLDENYSEPLTAMIVYALFDLALSFLAGKSVIARRFINGKPTILYHNGQIYLKNLKKSKIDLSELMESCRNSGYFDLNQLEMIIIETNGKMSFLPKVSDRPVTPNDLALSPEQQYLSAVLIMNGKLLTKNLKHSGKDELWLLKQLHNYGLHDYKEVLLATCDTNNKLSLFTYQSDGKEKVDILA